MADSEVSDTQEGAEIVQLRGRVSALEDEVASLKGALGELQMQFRNFVLSQAQEKSASSEQSEEKEERRSEDQEVTTHKEEEIQRAAPTGDSPAATENSDEVLDTEKIEQVVSAASIESMMGALDGEHKDEIIEMLQEDDFWMVRVMARKVENLEEDRDVRVRLMRALLVIGTQVPSVYELLMKRDSLTKWVYNDIQTENDDDLLFLALHMLSKISSLPRLPPHIKDRLGYNLVQFLIELTLKYNNHPDDVPVRDAALLALLNVNTQFETHDLKENRVLNKLVSMKEAQGDLGQLFISILNRLEPKEALLPVTKVFKDIFQNPLSSKTFFFTTDFNVLVEVLLRNLGDLADGPERTAQMDILEDLLVHGEYHKTLHRKSELVALLKELSDYEGDPNLAARARHILSTCTYLTH